ncbi:MAG TPA: hypothetical protein VM889_10440 [Candidatus Thermoplasmatota archaeon]|nr:hypothetical protein [Candidatus Thermoplasmatota archaeon]
MNEWRIMLDGTPDKPDGVYLAVGQNHHPAHGTEANYAIDRTVTLPPSTTPGEHVLKFAARHQQGAPWVVNTTTITVPACQAESVLFTIYRTLDDVPVPTIPYARTATYRLPNGSLAPPATFLNPCVEPGGGAAGDEAFELGVGGARIPASAPQSIYLVSDKGPIPFVVGTDRDANGILGDGPADCISGPFLLSADVTCVGDPTGHLTIVIVPPEDHEDWKREWHVVHLLNCILQGGCVRPPAPPDPAKFLHYEPDSNNNGYGDDWENEHDLHDHMNDLMNFSLDLDGDGLSNIDEYRWNTIPIGPIVTDATGRTYEKYPNAKDFDQDGWRDGSEAYYWNNPSNDHAPATNFWQGLQTALRDPDSEVQHYEDGDEKATVHDDDVDEDGVKDGLEYLYQLTFPQYPDSDCPATVDDCDGPGERFNSPVAGFQHNASSRGDGLNDHEEALQWASVGSRIGNPNAWRMNQDRDFTANNLLDFDSDGDGLSDALEFSKANWTLAYDFDTDSDGLLDGGDLVIPTNDPRYALFHDFGIVYQGEVGARRYLGEISQGTNPVDSDSNDNNETDGAEAPGEHPANIYSYEQRYVGSHFENQELPNLDPQVRSWLENGTRQFVQNATGPDGPAFLTEFINPLPLVHDLLNRTPEPIREVLPTQWIPTAYEGTVDTLDCIPGLPPPAIPDPNCLLERVSDVTLNLIDEIATEAIEHIPPPALQAVDRLSDILNVTRESIPLAEIIEWPTDLIETAGSDLGHTPGLPSAVLRPGVPGSPIDKFRWSDTVFPQVTADIANDLHCGLVSEVPVVPGAPPYDCTLLFRTLKQIDDGRAEQVALINSVDASHFNILVQDPSRGVYAIRANTPIGGVVLLDLDDINNTNPLPIDVDLVIRAELATGNVLSQSPKITIQRQTPAATQALVAAFIQIPNSDFVMMLGADATSTGLGHDNGLPGTIEFSLGMNALQNSLAMDPVYTAHAKVTPPNWPVKLGAAYIQVESDAQGQKSSVPGERADLVLYSGAAPAVFDATLTQGRSDHVTTLQWSASQIIDLYVGMQYQHANATTEVTTLLDDLPTALTTSFLTSDKIEATHSASSVLKKIVANWKDKRNTFTHKGGLAVSELPRSLALTLNSAEKRWTYTSESAFATVDAVVASYLSNDEMDCRRPKTGEYVTHLKESSGPSCTAASIRNLKSFTALVTDGGDVTFNVSRSAQGSGLFIHTEDPSSDFLLNMTPWPVNLDVRTASTPTTWTLDSLLSHPVTDLEIAYRDDETELNLTVKDIPVEIHAAALAAEGRINVTASTSTPITDVNFRFKRGTPISLGPNDGFILHTSDGDLEGAALRLRNFRSAQFNVQFSNGLSLTTDSTSGFPFVVRWSNGLSWFDADLPRLPARTTATYNVTDTAFDFRYRSTEAIENLNGSFRIAGARSTLLVNLTNFPKTVDVTAAFGTATTVNFNAERPVTAEVALAGPDRLVGRPNGWDNYIEVDRRNPVVTESGSVPQFHVKLKGLKMLEGVFDDAGVRVQRSAEGGGTLGVRYHAIDGDLQVNVTSILAPAFVFTASNRHARWEATPGYLLDTSGMADLDDFNGRWDVTGIPNRLDAEWNATNESFRAVLRHSAPPNQPEIDRIKLEGRFRVIPGAEPSPMSFDLRGIPARIETTADLVKGSFTYRSTNLSGLPVSTGAITASYAEREENGLPRIPRQLGAYTYAALFDGAREFAIHFTNLKRLDLAVDPAFTADRTRYLLYDAATAMNAAIEMRTATQGAIVATIDQAPAQLNLRLRGDDSTSDFTLESYASDPIIGLDLDWTTHPHVIRFDGDLASTTTLTRAGGRLTFNASEAVSFKASRGWPDMNVLPDAAFGEDYLVANLAGSSPTFALRARGLEFVDAYPDGGYLKYVRAPGVPFTFHVDAGNREKFTGRFTGMPTSATLRYAGNLDGANKAGVVYWDASGPMARAEVAAETGPTFFRMVLSGIPNEFYADIDAAEKQFILVANRSASFGSAQLSYAGDGQGIVPIQTTPGASIEVPSTGKFEHGRISAFIVGLSSVRIHVDTIATVVLVRNNPGGPFDVAFKNREFDARVHLDNLPTRVSLRLNATEPAQEVHVNITGHGEPIGAGRYHLKQAENMNLSGSFGGLPRDLDFRFMNTSGAFEVTYDGGSGATCCAQLFARGNIAGLTTRLSLTEIPGRFTFQLDPDERFASLTSDRGHLTGTATIHPQIQKPYELGGRGFALSNLPNGQFILEANLAGLETLSYRANHSGHYAHIAHTTSHQGSFSVAYEDAQSRVVIGASNLPKFVDVTAYVSSDVFIDYQADREVANLTLRTLNKTRTSSSGHLSIAPTPTNFTFHYRNTDEGLIQLDAAHNGKPLNVSFNFDDGGFTKFRGRVIGLPPTLGIAARLTEPSLLVPYLLFANASAPVPFVHFEAGLNRPDIMTTPQWFYFLDHGGGQRDLGVQLVDFKHAEVWQPSIEELAVTVSLGAPDVRFSVGKPADKNGNGGLTLRGGLWDRPAGTYRFGIEEDGTIRWSGTHRVGHLQVAAAVVKENFTDRHDLVNVDLVAHGVPGLIELRNRDGNLYLSSDRQVIDSIDVSIRLRDNAWYVRKDNHSPFAIDARNFFADHVKLVMGRSTYVDAIGSETNRVTIRNTHETYEMFVELAEFRGVSFSKEGQGLSQRQELKDLELRDNSSLRIFTLTWKSPVRPGDGDELLTLMIPKMPKTLSLTHLGSGNLFSTTITPGTDTYLESLHIAQGPDENRGLNYVIRDVSKSGVTINTFQGAAAYLSLVVPNPTIVDRAASVAVHGIEDSLHYVKGFLESKESATIEADTDGARDHLNNPSFLNLAAPNARVATFEIRWGSTGLTTQWLSLPQVTGPVMIGIDPAEVAKYRAFRNGLPFLPSSGSVTFIKDQLQFKVPPSTWTP